MLPLFMQLSFRNQGGFHLIGAGRDKIETDADLERAATTAREMDLDGIVIIGGDDSNTNAAVLAEFFLAKGRTSCQTN
jgi:diphosphate-dependent phosphofructokinase